MEEIQYFRATEIEYLHDIVMEIHGDLDQAGRDRSEEKENLFQSMLVQPQTMYFGNAQYSFPFEKACCYYHSIARNHLFHNGNKRTAFVVMASWLDLYGYVVTMLPQEVIEYTVTVAKHDEYKSSGAIPKIAQEMVNNNWVITKEEWFSHSDDYRRQFFNPFDPFDSATGEK